MDEVIIDRPTRKLVIKVETSDLTLGECVITPDDERTSPHFHKLHSDGFYVLEGTLTVTVDGEDRELGPGDVVLVPPGVVHCFFNASDRPVRFLNLHAPSAGFGDYMRALVRGDHDAAAQFDIYDA